MTGFALLIVGCMLGAGAVVVVAFRLLPTVRLQLGALALFAVAVPLTAVTVGGLVMFHMNDDVKILYVAVASASSAVAAALLLGRAVSRRIVALERIAARLAAGDLTARAATDGPRELASLASSFNRMAENLTQLFDARRQLVVWASHDLRTPLASMRAMFEAIEDGLAPADEYLPALRDQAGVLTRLVDDLFELARIDAGALTVELNDMSLDELLEGCVRALEPEAQARRVKLEVRRDDPLPEVRCARDHVQRVLVNLLTNALRYTPSDGSVVVVARPVGEELHVAVEDTGEGLSPEARQWMFDRFWRADPSRTRADGNAGLGLAIARGLVEAQGGRIWAENRAEGGARVAFSLPLAA